MAHIKKMTDKPRTRPWRAQVKRQGVAVVKMFQTKEQAERWARDEEKSIVETGLPKTNKNLQQYTLFDLSERYLKEITPHKGSQVMEETVIKALQRRSIAKKRLPLNKQDAWQYVNERLSDTWRGQKIAPSTVRRELNIIQHIFEVARERWGLDNLQNPFRGIAIKGSVRRRKRRLKDGELEKLAKASEDYFSEARKELSEVIERLHDALDASLRSMGHVPEGKDWKLKEDEAGGLCISVMAEPKQRGRRKPDVPIEKVSFQAKGSRAA